MEIPNKINTTCIKEMINLINLQHEILVAHHGSKWIEGIEVPLELKGDDCYEGLVKRAYASRVAIMLYLYPTDSPTPETEWISGGL